MWSRPMDFKLLETKLFNFSVMHACPISTCKYDKHLDMGVGLAIVLMNKIMIKDQIKIKVKRVVIAA